MGQRSLEFLFTHLLNDVRFAERLASWRGHADSSTGDIAHEELASPSPRSPNSSGSSASSTKRLRASPPPKPTPKRTSKTPAPSSKATSNPSSPSAAGVGGERRCAVMHHRSQRQSHRPIESQLLHSESSIRYRRLSIDNRRRCSFDWARADYSTSDKYRQQDRYRRWRHLDHDHRATCGAVADCSDDIRQRSYQASVRYHSNRSTCLPGISMHTFSTVRLRSIWLQACETARLWRASTWRPH